MTHLCDGPDLSMYSVVIHCKEVEIAVFNNECCDIQHQGRRSGLVGLRWRVRVGCQSNS